MKRISFFDRPLLSFKTTEETQKLIKDAESINQRLNDLEYNLNQLSRATVNLQKETGKALNQIVRSIDKRLIEQKLSIDSSLDQVTKSLSVHIDSFTQHTTSNNKQITAATASVNSISADLTGIRDFLNKSNNQNQRYQEGYDFQILKNFVRQIVRVINDLETQKNKIENPDDREAFEYAHDDLIELLERNSFEQITPEINTRYDHDKLKYWEVVEEKISTSSPELHGCVAEINRVGYLYLFNDSQERVIIPAQVKLYTSTEASGESSIGTSTKKSNNPSEQVESENEKGNE